MAGQIPPSVAPACENYEGGELKGVPHSPPDGSTFRAPETFDAEEKLFLGNGHSPEQRE